MEVCQHQLHPEVQIYIHSYKEETNKSVLNSMNTTTFYKKELRHVIN